ncbi:hypothetical protein H4R35_006895 [Dimargaris xerosporica]|nr:hypothetical protein H4R35_006895 [Dimargaris xerosporica]
MAVRVQTPYCQLVLMALISLCTNASWYAVLGVGGAGLMDSTLAAQANLAGAIASGLGGLVAGGVAKYLEIRWAMIVATTTYTLFMGSFVLYAYCAEPIPVLLTGALRGLGLSLMFVIQSVMIMQYPTVAQQGRYLSTFFFISQSSGIVGGLIALAFNSNDAARTLGLATYYSAVGLTVMTVGMAVLLVPPHTLTRADDTPVAPLQLTGWSKEITRSVGSFCSPLLVFLAPYFLASRWYTAYQLNCFNFNLLNIRTRATSNILYAVSSMGSSLLLGYYLDHARGHSQRLRGLVVTGLITGLVAGSYAGALVFQEQFLATLAATTSGAQLIDVTHPVAAVPLVLYVTWGALDSVVNSFPLWVLAQATRQPQAVAHHLGYCMFYQSAGLAAAWVLDSARVSMRDQNLVTLVVSLVGCGFITVVIQRYLATPTATQAKGQGLEKP